MLKCQCADALLTFLTAPPLGYLPLLPTYSQFCLPAILMSNALRAFWCQWSKCANALLTFLTPHPPVTYLSYWLTSSFTFRLTYFDVKGPTSRTLPILISNAISMLVCNECSNVSATKACLSFLKSKNVKCAPIPCLPSNVSSNVSAPTACLPFLKVKMLISYWLTPSFAFLLFWC